MPSKLVGTATTTPFNWHMTNPVVQYLLDDGPRTLFPTATVRHLVETGAEALFDYIYKDILGQSDGQRFAPQTRCYAAKAGFNLRRTLKLDPAAELFIYDLVYRNRTSFRKDHVANRQSFGYRFDGRLPISPMSSYREFRKAVATNSEKFENSLRLDVALYFNSIYHHDLTIYFSSLGWSTVDVEHLGRFLREINAGRSVDCLPHGMNPCKTLGAEFLKFIDNSAQLRCPAYLRFLDDIYLFSNSTDQLEADLLVIQQLLGEKGLSLNDSKTRWGSGPAGTVENEIDEMKQNLLQLRQELIEVSGMPVLVEGAEPLPLDDEQTEYLLGLLNDPTIDEADAELVLNLLTEHGQEVLESIGSILPRFPVLAKSLFTFLSKAVVHDGLDTVVDRFLASTPTVTEYQLFWITACVETYLSKTPKYGELLTRLFEHPGATMLSQARVLEIPEHRFGMPDLRAQYLRSGESTWRAWAAAVGCRTQTPFSRNHLLGYFANGSALNNVVARIIRGE